MPEEAKARGNAQDRLTSGRGSARESPESEATSHNTGSTDPAGGLASHPMEESPSACLPPPKAHGPSHEGWRCPNGTQPPKPAEQILVGPFVRGAPCDPRSPRATHGGDRRGDVTNPGPTMAPGWPTPAHQHCHPAEAHLDAKTWEPCKASTWHATPTRKGATDVGTPGFRARVGRPTVGPLLWLSPGTVLVGGHGRRLSSHHISAPASAHGRYGAGF
jgi:hypothetical protein